MSRRCSILMVCAGLACGPLAAEEFIAGDLSPAWRQPARLAPRSPQQLRVLQGRSQVLRSQAPITRAAVADSSVAAVLSSHADESTVVGLKPGTTELAVWRETEPAPRTFRLVVAADPFVPARALDAVALERRLNVLFPGSNVSLMPLARELLLKGRPASHDDAARIVAITRGELAKSTAAPASPVILALAQSDVREADLPHPLQVVDLLEHPVERRVRLRMTALEIDLDRLQALQVDLEALFAHAGTSPTSDREAARAPLAGVFEHAEIGVLVDWLAKHAAARVLARSTLVVSSGRSARFESAGALPVALQTPEDPGSVEPLSGFALSVVPALGDDGRIRLRVSPERDWQAAETGSGNPLPTQHVRRSAAEGLLDAGQVFVVTGIGRSRAVTSRSLPLLGELSAGSARPSSVTQAATDASRTDLLLIITPEMQ